MKIDIISAMEHDRLFARWFRGDSWNRWKAILRAAYGLKMSRADKRLFAEVAERRPPRKRVRELWIAASRRSGKDSIASLIAAHSAAFFDGQDRLRRGERALVLPLACERTQAKIVLNYTRAFFSNIPPLAEMVTRTTLDGFELANSVDIAIATNSYRSVRGRPILCGILDECAFYADEMSATPDVETYRAITPGMATLVPDSMLIGISSPYRKAGLLFEKYRKHYGVDDDEVLFIKGPTKAFNPTIDKRIIEQAFIDDPVSAAAEWGGEFLESVSDFIMPSVLDAVIAPDYTPPAPAVIKTRSPVAATDISGGSGKDSFATAVAWFDSDNDRAVLAGVLETPGPYSPEVAIQQHADFLRGFGCSTVIGDKYAGLWPVERWRHWGVEYRTAARDRSGIYHSFLPILNSQRCILIPESAGKQYGRMRSQFLGLERREMPGGRTRIDHSVRANAHDDVCQVAAHALVLAHDRPRGGWYIGVGPSWEEQQAEMHGLPPTTEEGWKQLSARICCSDLSKIPPELLKQ
jgi:hypothetical protein